MHSVMMINKNSIIYREITRPIVF